MELRNFVGTLNASDTHAFWRYCTEGGVENAQLALRFAAHLDGAVAAAMLLGLRSRDRTARPIDIEALIG